LTEEGKILIIWSIGKCKIPGAGKGEPEAAMMYPKKTQLEI